MGSLIRRYDAAYYQHPLGVGGATAAPQEDLTEERLIGPRAYPALRWKRPLILPRRYDNHEVHAASAVGPFCGHREDQFGVYFDMDVSFKPSGERSKLVEVGLYTVANGQIVQEEFWYLTP